MILKRKNSYICFTDEKTEALGEKMRKSRSYSLKAFIWLESWWTYVHSTVWLSTVRINNMATCPEAKDQSFSSITHSCLALCSPIDYSMSGLPVHHQLPELVKTHVLWVGDAIQPSHPLSSPSPPALNLSQHQGVFQWVGSWHQVAKALELQHKSFQWIFSTDFL